MKEKNPFREEKLDELLGEKEDHPSYGLIGISRVTSSGGMSLYGCSILNHSTIRLRIARSSKRRKHNRDSNFAEDRLIEIEMSPEQYANLITSMNLGDGVPCTIRWIEGVGSIPEPPFGNMRAEFVKDFRKHTDKVARKFDDVLAKVRAMAEKPSVGKAERAELLKEIALLKQTVQADTPFIATMFNEQVEKTIAEAKAEIDATLTNLVQQAGVEALRSGNFALTFQEPTPALGVNDGDDRPE